MQIIFYTENKPESFKVKNYESFPPPPDKCPFHDCTMPVRLMKHGFYERFFISKSFTGIIYIRRYICPICGRTVSMLPMFCLQNFQYSGISILNILHELYQSGISLNKLIHRINSDLPIISRRHINHYRRRIIKNRQLIQYGLNLMSPEFILSGTIPENQKWVKDFLEKVHSIHPHVFLVRFSNITGKSFMTSQNMIA
jgi:transposase-like protein